MAEPGAAQRLGHVASSLGAIERNGEFARSRIRLGASPYQTSNALPWLKFSADLQRFIV